MEDKMRTLNLALAINLVICPIANAGGLSPAVKADLYKQSNLAYGVILANAAKAGRIYPREQAVSGAHRHYAEFAARQMLPQNEVALSQK
jgi:hypothetical protein